jgi:hypothetical protein
MADEAIAVLGPSGEMLFRIIYSAFRRKVSSDEN